MSADTLTVQLAQRGVLTLPQALRKTYKMNPGDQFTLLDLGGIFVLSPRRSEVDRLANRISAALIERGVNLGSVLSQLRGEREVGSRKKGAKK